MTCTDAGNADIAWSNIYAPAADGLEQGVSFYPVSVICRCDNIVGDDLNVSLEILLPITTPYLQSMP